MSVNLLLWVLALVFMLLAAFNAPTRDRISWYHLSLACVIAAQIV